MELLGNLKDKVEKANSREEAKELIRNAGMLLTDEELDLVAGGVVVTDGKGNVIGEFESVGEQSGSGGVEHYENMRTDRDSRGPLNDLEYMKLPLQSIKRIILNYLIIKGSPRLL